MCILLHFIYFYKHYEKILLSMTFVCFKCKKNCLHSDIYTQSAPVGKFVNEIHKVNFLKKAPV